MNFNIQHTIEQNAIKGNYLNSIAVTQKENTKKINKITYNELFILINNVSNHLFKLKIKPQDKILLSTQNSLNFIITFLGAIKIGIIPIPGNPELNNEQTNHIISDSNPKLIITDKVKKNNKVNNIIYFKNKEWIKSLKTKYKKNSNFYKPKNKDYAFIIYSSGTTGKPKGIIHRHQSIINTTNLHKNILKLKINDKIFTTSKLFFAYALGNNLFAPLILGLNSIFDDTDIKFINISNIIKYLQPKIIFSVPTMYRRILRNKEENISLLRKIKHYVSAGERIPNILYQDWKNSIRYPLLNCYGTTETLAIVIATRPKFEKIGSTGKPITGIKTKLISKNKISSNNNGILHIKHDGFSKEYLNNTNKNKNIFKSGWINTGDIWTIKNNYWYFEGREDDLIKVASKWVNPKEIERKAIKIVGVLDAFCITAQSKDDTNRLALFLYTKNQEDKKILKNIDNNIKSLPNYKKPYWIKIIHHLPQTATGKIKKNTLKKLIEKK